MNIDDVRQVLGQAYPSALVNELIQTYSDLKKNFFLANHRPNEVEGGRFAEVVFRMLEHRSRGRYTAIGRHLDSDRIIQALAQLPNGSQPDSIRLHIPRTLRLIYDVRNKRDAAHLEL